MTGRRVGMMRCLIMMPGLVMPRRFLVVFGGMAKML
jgi:hypothetical protein